MDWQDELRRLDKQLSGGEISAQDYRRMRDELLAEASAPAQGRGSLWSSARPEAPEPAQPAPASPAPPAPPADEDAEDTQIVADTTVVVEEAVVHGQPVEETVVQGQPVEETVVQAAPVEETVVQGRPVEPPAPMPMAVAEPVAEPAEPPAPAGSVEIIELVDPAEDPDRTATVHAETVAESDKKKVPTFPPRPADRPAPVAPPLPAPAPWTGQVLGEEVFADAKPESNVRRGATVLLSLVVALAVVGGAVWYFAFRSDEAPAAKQPQNPPATSSPQSQAPTQQPAPSAPRPSGDLPTNLADVVGPLPGATDKNSGTISPARAGQLKLVAPEEVATAIEYGVTDVIFRGSTKGSVGNALLVFTTPDALAAAELTKAERDYLSRAGFVPGKELRGGLPVLERNDGSATVYRVVYTTGKYTVRFGVAQRDANPDQLRRELETVADTILAVLPPS